jgi:hypothetical protein
LLNYIRVERNCVTVDNAGKSSSPFIKNERRNELAVRSKANSFPIPFADIACPEKIVIRMSSDALKRAREIAAKLSGKD